MQALLGRPRIEGLLMLSPTAKKEFRLQLRRFCLVAIKYERFWSYTQFRPFSGIGVPPSRTHHNDCSGFVGCAYYDAGVWSGHGVHDPLDEGYSGWGNTDTCYAYVKAHPAPRDKYRIGDIALYLERSYEHHHVVVCIANGTAETSDWASHGGESGPEHVKLHYRHDLTGVYRHPALL